MRWLLFALCLWASPLQSQVWSLGWDRNGCCPLVHAGDPPVPPKIGSQITLEWWSGAGWMEGVCALVFGPDVPVEANICWYSQDPSDLRDKWLLTPPIIHIPRKVNARTGTGYEYRLTIPDDVALIGLAVRCQAFMLGFPRNGGTSCSRLRATVALRIQFMR